MVTAFAVDNKSQSSSGDSSEIFYYYVDDSFVPRLQSQEKIILIKIPERHPKLEQDPKINAFAKRLAPTFNGKIISVNYNLSLYVKHDAWNEWGRGRGVTLPIKIFSQEAP